MIDREVRDGIAIVRMAHGKANALDLELVRALRGALREDGARATVLTAAGGIFCAGVDLHRILGEDAAYADAFLLEMVALFHEWFTHPVPCVAALNGHAVAGGCILAMAADVRVAAAGAWRIGVPELVVGVPFPATALEIVRFAAPPQLHSRLVSSGAVLSVNDAQREGLIEHVVAPDALLDEAIARARDMAATPPEAFAVTKRALRAPSVERYQAARAHDDEVRRLWGSEEVRDSIRRHMDRVGERAGRGSDAGQT